MSKQQTLPCPECQTPIPFDVEAMLRGEKFQCTKCHATVGLGEKPDVNAEIERLEARLAALKQQAGKK